jgi:hypothetical protein
MKSSLRYGSYKFALQILSPTDPEGKYEFEWPHTPNFEVNPSNFVLGISMRLHVRSFKSNGQVWGSVDFIIIFTCQGGLMM